MGYFQHGAQRHSPEGTDATASGVLHFVGDLGEYEVFVNGVNMAPTTDIPNPHPLAISLVVGPPNIMEHDGVSIRTYTKHKLEIIGDVDDVSPGDVITIIRPSFRQPYDAPLHAHDSVGNYIACRLLSTGELIYGTP